MWPNMERGISLKMNWKTRTRKTKLGHSDFSGEYCVDVWKLINNGLTIYCSLPGWTIMPGRPSRELSGAVQRILGREAQHPAKKSGQRSTTFPQSPIRIFPACIPAGQAQETQSVCTSSSSIIVRTPGTFREPSAQTQSCSRASPATGWKQRTNCGCQWRLRRRLSGRIWWESSQVWARHSKSSRPIQQWSGLAVFSRCAR